MGKSQASFGKKENEKKRQKKKQEKEERKEERQAAAKSGQSLDEMLAYVDENGNISSTPPGSYQEEGNQRGGRAHWRNPPGRPRAC